jgi:ABC-2 type transport system permease protein
VTASTALRPRPSRLRQWWVLTARVVGATLRSGEVVIAVAMSAIFTASFYLPLKQIMSSVVVGSYAQYLMPAIALQTIYFAAMSAALLSASDAVDGVNRRFAAMPIAVTTPLAARMSANVYRCAIGLAMAVVWGYVIGFRFHRDWEYTAAFCILVLLIGVVVSFVGDLVGLVSSNPESTSYVLLLPLLTLGMLSVAFQPAQQFPTWIQPFIRNQPHSQFIYALQALAGDATGYAVSPSWSVLGPALLWLSGIAAITVPLYAIGLRSRG